MGKARTETVRVPDIGEFEGVDVVEVLVAVGDRVEAEQGLIVIESDKASMEVPSPRAGVVRELHVAVDDSVSEGDPVATLELDEAAEEAPESGAAEPHPRADELPREARARPEAPRAEAPREREPQTQTGKAPEREPRRGAAGRDRFDLVVLGAGPGGYTAAFRAADLGLRVALVDREPTLGGVCLNVGCIPSKALLHVAEVIEAARDLDEAGVAFGAPRLDLDKLRARKDAVVARLTGGLARLAEQRGVEVVQGTGRFADAHHLEVEAGDGMRTLPFAHAIVGVGSEPVRLPSLPDDPRIMDSTGALELRDLPERLLVVGGGIIGLEMAAVYQALGSRVTIVELLDGLMAEADRDLVRPLEKRLRARCEAIHLGTRVVEAKATSGGIRVRLEGKDVPERPEPFDRVLVAVGRRPLGGAIGAERAGVRVDERGFIAVDRELRTNVGHLFAIGDVTGPPLLAHRASHQGKVAAEVIAGHAAAFDARAVPAVAYTDPEVAWTGLTEATAREQGIPVRKAVFPWSAHGRALGAGRPEGLTKLLFSAEDGRLVGAGIVGPHAGELIGETTLAIELGADAEDIALTVHPHPTLSETVAFAAEVAAGTVTDLMPPRRR